MGCGKKAYDEDLEVFDDFMLQTKLTGSPFNMNSSEHIAAQKGFKEAGLTGQALLAYVSHIMAAASIYEAGKDLQRKAKELEMCQKEFEKKYS
jgi:hypothetical protein